jgi:hypothetical protein
MTSLRVVAIVWACPGGWLGARTIPAAVQPLLCAPTALVEDYDPAQRRQAEDRARELGAGARLEACQIWAAAAARFRTGAPSFNSRRTDHVE